MTRDLLEQGAVEQLMAFGSAAGRFAGMTTWPLMSK